jgi:hypothetical protein
MKKVINIDVLVKERTKKLFSKNDNILDCIIDAPLVDPKRLSIDDKIFYIETKPVVNRVHEMSDGSLKRDTGVTSLLLVGVQSEEISSISKKTVGDKEYRMFNGSITLPIDGQVSRTSLDKAYFDDEATANAVAMAALEIEIEKAEAIRDEATKAEDLLKMVYSHYENSSAKQEAPLA